MKEELAKGDLGRGGLRWAGSHGKKPGAPSRPEARRCRPLPEEGAAVGDHPREDAAGPAMQGPPQDVIGAWLKRLRLGRAKECGGVAWIPLLEPLPAPPPSPAPGHSGNGACRVVDKAEEGGMGPRLDGRDYRSMPEAMARGELLVTEVSPEGVVGEVLVVNGGRVPVLMLEGEEWSGARQNRVLRESILVRPGCAVRVPVVCSEPGRWGYLGKGAGPAMGDSGVCLPLDLRAALRAAGHRANVQPGDRAGDRAQEVVRRGLMGWQSRLGMGETMAEWQEREIRRWEGLEEAFAWVPGQVGWMAWLEGAWHSVEVVSRPAAWRRWHGKWLRCVLAGADPRGAHHGRDMPGLDAGWREEARAVLVELAGSEGPCRPGVDMGEVHTPETFGWMGAALVEGGEVLHAGWQRDGREIGRLDRGRRRGAVPSNEVKRPG